MLDLLRKSYSPAAGSTDMALDGMAPAWRETPLPSANEAVVALDSLALGRPFVVRSVASPETSPEWGTWLEEIGFIPGERGMLMARGIPGGDPYVVRIGLSTFALRRAEAACVEVIPLDEKRAQ